MLHFPFVLLAILGKKLVSQAASKFKTCHFGDNKQDHFLCLDTKFVLLFLTVMEIQCFQCLPSYFAPQGFPFSGPTAAFSNLA